VFTIRILKNVLILCDVLLFIYSFYIMTVALFSTRKMPAKAFPRPHHRFAVLIAARNEAPVIGCLVESLLKQRYPRDLFDVWVVPNNCTDQTRSVALSAGAKIMTCPGFVRSKGAVLNFALPELSRQNHGYDAICVMDADNLAHPDFLLAMNQALHAGARVAQGYRDSKNPNDTAISGSYSIYFWFLNRFFNRARQAAGLSVPIGGTGFMISTGLVRDMAPLRLHTITEDTELSILCSLAGEKVRWAPKAIVYDEQPLTFRQSWVQRRRWSSGMIQLSVRYTRPIIQNAIRNRRLWGLDFMVLYTMAHVQILCLLSLLLKGLLDFWDLAQDHITLKAILAIGAQSTLITCLVITIIAFLTAILEQKSDKKPWTGILTYWFFLMSWIPINLVSFFKHDTHWEPIRHQRSVRYSDLS
jgi:cellulose synthase/poly-beta-1,6-N-acetylglucosamine synthase-like glycosyltransferase